MRKEYGKGHAFYEDFFEQAVTVRDEIYSVFDIHGFRLGLFNFQKMNEDHVFGSNVLPSIEVDSLETLKKKIQKQNICFPLTQIGANWVTEFVDSEGNHLELTAPVK